MSLVQIHIFFEQIQHTTLRKGIDNSEDLERLLTDLEEGIQIPPNATKEETVQLIQDHSEVSNNGVNFCLKNVRTKKPLRYLTDTIICEQFCMLHECGFIFKGTFDQVYLSFFVCISGSCKDDFCYTFE